MATCGCELCDLLWRDWSSETAFWFLIYICELGPELLIVGTLKRQSWFLWVLVAVSYLWGNITCFVTWVWWAVVPICFGLRDFVHVSLHSAKQMLESWTMPWAMICGSTWAKHVYGHYFHRIHLSLTVMLSPGWHFYLACLLNWSLQLLCYYLCQGATHRKTCCWM